MPDSRLWHGGLHPLDSAHRLPIVFVLSRAEEAHVVILAVGSTPGPGELVAAPAKPENVQNLRHIFFTDDDVGDSSDHLTSDRKCVDYFRAAYFPCPVNVSQFSSFFGPADTDGEVKAGDTPQSLVR